MLVQYILNHDDFALVSVYKLHKLRLTGFQEYQNSLEIDPKCAEDRCDGALQKFQCFYLQGITVKSPLRVENKRPEAGGKSQCKSSNNPPTLQISAGFPPDARQDHNRCSHVLTVKLV